MESALPRRRQSGNGIRAIGYPCFTIVRPSLIDAQREHSRPFERAGIVAMRALMPLIPRRYRAVKPDAIGRALIDGVLKKLPGEVIVASEQLQP